MPAAERQEDIARKAEAHGAVSGKELNASYG